MIWLLLVAATLLYLYFRKVNEYWSSRGVRQGDPVPFFGDIFGLLFNRNTGMDMVLELYNKHPGTRFVGFYQFLKPTLLIKDLDLVKQITVKDFEHFGDHHGLGIQEVDPVSGRILFSAKGKQWRNIRATLSPTFTPSKLRNMYPLMKRQAEEFIATVLEQDDPIDVDMMEFFSFYVNDVCAITMFGMERINSLKEKNNELLQMHRELIFFTSLATNFKFHMNLFWPELTKLGRWTLFNEKAVDYISDFVFKTIKEREEKNIQVKDALQLLIDARKGKSRAEPEETNVGDAATENKSEEEIITDADIVSNILSFTFETFHSIPTLLSFAAHELSVNPDVQSRLREEIDETFERTEGNITYEDIIGMKYIDMVISETLRKWPIAYAMERECTKDYTFEPQTPDERPIHMKKGDLLWIPTGAFHRDPKLFPEPEKFDPERFNEENKKNMAPYSFMAFGFGPRNCIGGRFVILEAKMLLCNLLHHFEIEPSPKSKQPLNVINNTFAITLADVWMKLNRRDKK